MRAPTVRFWLDVRVNGGAVVIGVHGELDADTAAQLSACAAAAVESSDDDVCFELDQVTFMDSCGPGCWSRPASRSPPSGGPSTWITPATASDGCSS